MDSSRPKDVDSEGKSDLKDAVSFLLRGGSLLGVPCTTCSGVQIKYKNEIICINCGKQQPIDEISAKPVSEHQPSDAIDRFHGHRSYSSRTIEEEIEERILEQFKILKSESNDVNNEKKRIELIGMYFDLLERLRNYSKGLQK